MAILFLISLVVVLATGLALAFVAWRFVFPAVSETPIAGEWISSFSVERYGAMLHLLNDDDLVLLELQPRFTPAIAARLRQQRYRTFVAYLQSLRRDFNRVSAGLKLILVHSNLDRPDLSAALVHAQFAFAWDLATAYVRAYVWKLGYGAVSAAPVLGVFGSLCQSFECLLPKSPITWSALDDFPLPDNA